MSRFDDDTNDAVSCDAACALQSHPTELRIRELFVQRLDPNDKRYHR